MTGVSQLKREKKFEMNTFQHRQCTITKEFSTAPLALDEKPAHTNTRSDNEKSIPNGIESHLFLPYVL
jgi:hypothetical protein